MVPVMISLTTTWQLPGATAKSGGVARSGGGRQVVRRGDGQIVRGAGVVARSAAALSVAVAEVGRVAGGEVGRVVAAGAAEVAGERRGDARAADDEGAAGDGSEGERERKTASHRRHATRGAARTSSVSHATSVCR